MLILCCKSNYCFDHHNKLLQFYQNMLWQRPPKWQIFYQKTYYLPIFQLNIFQGLPTIHYFFSNESKKLLDNLHRNVF
jgi:hypothetical protein